jgi:hypothetical protein
MGSSIPRPVIAQAVVVIMAAALFTGVLTIVGSAPTSDVREHALRNADVTATPVYEDGLSATVTSAPEPVGVSSETIPAAPVPDDSLVMTVTPVPDVDDMISQPDMNVLSLPVTLSGSGSKITESFSLVPGMVYFDLWSDAPGDFEVWLLYDNGERFGRLPGNDLIAEGPVTEEIVTGGPYFLGITADGEWKINVSQAESV